MRGWQLFWLGAVSVGLAFALAQLSSLHAELERVVGVLSRLAEATQTVPAEPRVASDALGSRHVQPVQGPTGAPPDGGLPRDRAALAALVRQAVRAEHARQSQGADAASEPVDPERVLEIVKRDQGAILARHLEFHAGRWAAAREQSLDDFSERVGLSPNQRARLDVLSGAEIDEMVELFKQPRFRDHPAAFAKRWASTLAATDHEVEQLLDEDQMAAWRKGRAVERKLLFPWLE